jgi:drug/metabolite transporter (DMT)-like permease
LGQVRHNLKNFLTVGIFIGIAIICEFAALNLTFVAYANSVKRLNILFSVLYGYFLFKEKNLKEHLAGAMVITAGVALIGVFSL